MKRGALLAIVTVLIITSLSTTAFASSNEYALDELELKVTIPSEYSVITRDTPAADPIFGRFSTTKSAIMNQFEASGIYLNAVSDEYNEEIVVTLAENDLNDFSLISETVLNAFAELMVDEYSKLDIIVSHFEIYNHPQIKFIKVYCSDTASTFHNLQYCTTYNGKAMSFTMRSYDGSISARQERAIKSVVDSIIFNNAPLMSDIGEHAEPCSYADADTGVNFQIPANWKKEDFNTSPEMLDVKFVSTKDFACTIVYGSVDIWGQLSTSEREGYTRSTFNNEAVTIYDIAEVYGVDPSEIAIVEYNGKQYYKGKINQSVNTFGLDITLTITELSRIENGWLYTFQFCGTPEHTLYPEFEKVLNSVQYPMASTASAVEDQTTNGSNFILTIVVIGCVIMLITIGYMVNRPKSAEETKQTDSTVNSTELPHDPNPVVRCKNCGQALPPDSLFCHICGAKIDAQ